MVSPSRDLPIILDFHQKKGKNKEKEKGRKRRKEKGDIHKLLIKVQLFTRVK